MFTTLPACLPFTYYSLGQFRFHSIAYLLLVLVNYVSVVLRSSFFLCIDTRFSPMHIQRHSTDGGLTLLCWFFFALFKPFLVHFPLPHSWYTLPTFSTLCSFSFCARGRSWLADDWRIRLPSSLPFFLLLANMRVQTTSCVNFPSVFVRYYLMPKGDVSGSFCICCFAHVLRSLLLILQRITIPPHFD